MIREWRYSHGWLNTAILIHLRRLLQLITTLAAYHTSWRLLATMPRTCRLMVSGYRRDRRQVTLQMAARDGVIVVYDTVTIFNMMRRVGKPLLA